MTSVATLVADGHAHVKDAQGIDEAGSEAQDVLDELKGEIVTSIVCGYVMLCPWVNSSWGSRQSPMQRLRLTKNTTACQLISGL